MLVAIKDKNGELTIGLVDMAKVGAAVTVKLRDENGMPIEVTGEVTDILED